MSPTYGRWQFLTVKGPVPPAQNNSVCFIIVETTVMSAKIVIPEVTWYAMLNAGSWASQLCYVLCLSRILVPFFFLYRQQYHECQDILVVAYLNKRQWNQGMAEQACLVLAQH